MSSNTAHKALAARKRVRAVQLRSMGRTFDQIAAAMLPCFTHRSTEGDPQCDECLPMYANRSSAKRAVDAALADEYAATADTREQMRRHQLAQIDLLLQRVMPEALGSGPGHLEAQRNALRALDRRAKLLGLDAPSRVQITSELDEQIEELMNQLTEETTR